LGLGDISINKLLKILQITGGGRTAPVPKGQEQGRSSWPLHKLEGLAERRKLPQ